MKKSSLVIATALLISLNAYSQEYPHDIPEYPFLELTSNRIFFPGDSSGFKSLYKKMDEVLFKGKGQVNIMHMGGSHIQAGILSSTMRTNMQTMQSGLNSYRGYLFPFRVAGTNNPSNYFVSYTGRWSDCRNVENNRDCHLGLSGMSVTTVDSTATIKITFNDAFPVSGFTRVRVFCRTDSSSFNPVANKGQQITSTQRNDFFVEYNFAQEQDSLVLSLERKSLQSGSFTLLGLQFENDMPGFAYHAIGVNGASIPSYLRCDLLADHVKYVHPDLVILSIGINDAYGTRFSKSFYKENYRKLIQELKKGNPDVQILFTTNNDSYYRRRYVNKNGILVREAMFELAKEYGAGVWDLFTVMGGLGSITKWENYGLSKSDKVHFTPEGYELAGNMLFSAFIKSYEYHIKTTKTSK